MAQASVPNVCLGVSARSGGQQYGADVVVRQSRWLKAGVIVALAGVLATSYATVAQSKRWFPFSQPCQVVVNIPPAGLSRASTGANADGHGRALVFWSPPKCVGTNHPITEYQITAWEFDGSKITYAGVRTAPGNARSIVFTRLDDRHAYDFGIAAKNTIGWSSTTFTNIVVPPNETRP